MAGAFCIIWIDGEEEGGVERELVRKYQVITAAQQVMKVGAGTSTIYSLKRCHFQPEAAERTEASL